MNIIATIRSRFSSNKQKEESAEDRLIKCIVSLNKEGYVLGEIYINRSGEKCVVMRKAENSSSFITITPVRIVFGTIHEGKARSFIKPSKDIETLDKDVYILDEIYINKSGKKCVVMRKAEDSDSFITITPDMIHFENLSEGKLRSLTKPSKDIETTS